MKPIGILRQPVGRGRGLKRLFDVCPAVGFVSQVHGPARGVLGIPRGATQRGRPFALSRTASRPARKDFFDRRRGEIRKSGEFPPPRPEPPKPFSKTLGPPGFAFAPHDRCRGNDPHGSRRRRGPRRKGCVRIFWRRHRERTPRGKRRGQRTFSATLGDNGGRRGRRARREFEQRLPLFFIQQMHAILRLKTSSMVLAGFRFHVEGTRTTKSTVPAFK